MTLDDAFCLGKQETRSGRLRVEILVGHEVTGKRPLGRAHSCDTHVRIASSAIEHRPAGRRNGIARAASKRSDFASSPVRAESTAAWRRTYRPGKSLEPATKQCRGVTDPSAHAMNIAPAEAAFDPTVYIVDDDAAVRDSLALLLGLKNLRVLVFANAEDFLSACSPDWHGCVLLDMRLPGMGGLELQHELLTRGIRLPVVIMTAHSNLAAARVAFKAGAVEFLVKPVSEVELMDALRDAMAIEGSSIHARLGRPLAKAGLEKLTSREREVLALLVNGLSSREVANKLAISPHTVEVYKGRMMGKLSARSLSDLIASGSTDSIGHGAVAN